MLRLSPAAITLVAALAGWPALAAPPTKTKVIFIGGYLSTQAQVDLWASEAGKARPLLEFAAYPYPAGASASAQGAVNGARQLIQKIADEINANPTRFYVVAGHSSGAAISNAIGAKVKAKGHVTLASLDGFAPSAALVPNVDYKCVYSSGASSAGNSRNAGSMKSCGNAHAAVIRNAQCKSAWCGHFAVINKNTPGALSGSDFAKRGYENCVPELSWIP